MGKKRIVMKDIAREMNVSINTVSLALNHKDGLNEKTRCAIIAKAKEMGYELPAAQQAAMDNIILLLDKRYTNDLSFYARVVYGVTNCASQNNCNVVVDFFNNNNPALPLSISNKTVGGILVAGKVSEEFLSLLETSELPLVLIDQSSFHFPSDCVGTQNLQGCYTATSYLIEQRHRKIGFVGDIQYSFSLQERWLGFRSCIENHAKIGVEQDYTSLSVIAPIAEIIISHDYEALAQILQKMPQLPSAFVCCNDETAICVYHALSLLGYHVGKDISLIGFDDIEEGKRVAPPLTTMHIHKMQMGETAFLRLLARMQNPALPLQCITLPVELVERDSVRPPATE